MAGTRTAHPLGRIRTALIGGGIVAATIVTASVLAFGGAANATVDHGAEPSIRTLPGTSRWIAEDTFRDPAAAPDSMIEEGSDVPDDADMPSSMIVEGSDMQADSDMLNAPGIGAL